MVRRVIVHDDVLNTCERAELVPYPNVTNVNIPAQDAVDSITNPITGQRTWQINADRTTPLAGVAALTDNQRGLSLGEVQIPVNRALTVAELTQPNADRVSVPLRYLDAVFANMAAEPASRGLMNFDGTLGLRFRRVGINIANWATDMPLALSRYNGAYVMLFFSSTDTGITIDMPQPQYLGQTFILSMSGTAASEPTIWTEIRINFPQVPAPNPVDYAGLVRNTQHQIGYYTPASAPQGIIARRGERYLFYATNAGPIYRWHVVPFQLSMNSGTGPSGTGFMEKADGTTEIWGTSNMPAANRQVFAVPLNPLTITNPGGNLVVTAMHAITAPYAVGNIVAAADANAGGFFHHIAQADTATTVALARNSPTPAAATGVVHWSVKNARIDYNAMGGIASFGP